MLDTAPEGNAVRLASLDAIIVGSSPLMLMLAIRLARQGHSVALVEELPELGGAWRKVEIFDGEPSEMACHLVEPYQGVYELLEAYSDEPFEILRPQPRRVLTGGLSVNYGGRGMTMAAGLKNLALWNSLRLKSLVRISAEDRARLRRQGDVSAANFRTFASRQIPLMWTDGVQLRGPRNGFGYFIAGLTAQVRRQPITLITGKAIRCARTGNRWQITLDDGRSLVADNAYFSQSIGLVPGSEEGIQPVRPSVDAHIHCVIEIDRELVTLPTAYSMIRGHPVIRRFSRLDRPRTHADQTQLYLVQLRRSVASIDDYGPELLIAMQKLGVLAAHATLADLHERDRIVMLFAEASEDAEFRSHAGEGLHILPTIGNLSRSIVETEQLLKPTGFSW